VAAELCAIVNLAVELFPSAADWSDGLSRISWFQVMWDLLPLLLGGSSNLEDLSLS